MTYFVVLLGVGYVLGGLAVASNPSPYYGVVGLVLGSVMGCAWLVSLGVPFVALVLFMVYLRGMLVVFVYSVCMAADPIPEAWGDTRVLGYGVGMVLVHAVGVVVGGVEMWKVGVVTVEGSGSFVGRLDLSGVAMFYSWGVGMFFAAGWGLSLTLYVVLELVRGLSCGAIRAV
uniref:NADH-ubiquinone oxidoreductase chain 6 n=1 Tax=Accipiter gularis TaxID=258530 RepID=A0A1D8R9Y4_9AVES